jgi:hypothetical protein
VQLNEIKKWLKVIAKEKVETDNFNRKDTERVETLGDESVLEQSSATSQEKTIKVASSVKKGYGSSIMQYFSTWGSSENN